MDKFVEFLLEIGEKGIMNWYIIVLILIIVYILFNPEKAMIIKGWIQSWFVSFSSKARKGTVANNVRARIITATKTDNFGTKIDKYLPNDLKIEWVNEENVESILEDKKVIIRMSHKNTSKENYVRAVSAFVSEGFIPNSRKYIDKKTLKAADLFVMNRLVNIGYSTSRDYFTSEYLTSFLENDDDLNELYNSVISIDNNGIFFPILINEYEKVGALIYPSEPDECLLLESKELLRFLLRIVEKARDEDVDLVFKREYFKIRVVLAIKNRRLPEWHINQSVKRSIKDAKKGIESIYILALGSKVKMAKMLSEKIEANNTKVTDKKLTSYKFRSNGKHYVNGVCIQLEIRD